MDQQHLIDRLRADLTGFTVAAAEQVLGPIAQRALGREQSLPAQRAVRGRSTDPVATLLAVFVLGLPVTRAALGQALPALGTDGAVALELVAAAGSCDDDEVRSRVDLRPYAASDDAGAVDWWMLSDPGELATGKALQPDHVLGVGGASLTLARSAIRRSADAVLDLGTGCGIQALHAARHAKRVIGTDVSARALRIARFNWQLNAATVTDATFEARHGSLFEPVAAQRFDLVVSNPPFVITPRQQSGPEFEYRDAGLVGDRVVQHLVEGMGAVLNPGGVAQLLGNWEVRRGEQWTDRLESWLSAGDLDAWVIQREVQDPAEYAETWIRDAGQHLGPDPGHADALYDAWLSDFESRGVEAIGFGLITLRHPRSGHVTLRRLEERRDGAGLPAGHVLEAGLGAHDWLIVNDDEALWRTAFRVAGDVTEERHHRPGAEDPSVILLRQGGGAQRVVHASTELAGFVGACAGDLESGQIADALAVLLDRDAGAVRAELLPQIRRLVADGLLLP